MFFCIFILFATVLHASHDPVADCKSALFPKGILQDILQDQKNPSIASLAKAVQLLNEQQEEQSFCEFFKALRLAPTTKNRVMTPSERALFEELLPLYLTQDCEEKVTTSLQQHPEYASVSFLLAASFANQLKFEPFYYLFYNAYLVYPKSYLSYKIQGVLATLIAQRAKTPDEKNEWKNQAMLYFKQAFEEYPQDVSLHKMMIYTVNEAQRKEVIQQIISKIVEKNVQICRSELAFYITHALRAEDTHLAQSLIDKAKSWYEYSRIIDQLQQQVEESKHGRKP